MALFFFHILQWVLNVSNQAPTFGVFSLKQEQSLVVNKTVTRPRRQGSGKWKIESGLFLIRNRRFESSENVVRFKLLACFCFIKSFRGFFYYQMHFIRETTFLWKLKVQCDSVRNQRNKLVLSRNTPSLTSVPGHNPFVKLTNSYFRLQHKFVSILFLNWTLYLYWHEFFRNFICDTDLSKLSTMIVPHRISLLTLTLWTDQRHMIQKWTFASYVLNAFVSALLSFVVFVMWPNWTRWLCR